MQRILPFALVISSALPALARADDKTAADLATQLRQVEAHVFSADAAKAKQLDQMVSRDIRARIHAAHQREAEAFNRLQNRAEWERFRDERIKALRDALGPWPPAGAALESSVTSTWQGEGYRRDNLVFMSRPGLPVTANLYRPAEPGAKRPGLVIIHGFHQPKHQGELQDMGVNWARLGCVVLVPDVLGHGERRQHPFSDAGKFAGKFNVNRQDYYGRANSGLQLALAGESLMGCMVNDVARCVDLLTSRPDVDKERIIVLGAVAAGGDVAAVAAALDKGIAAAVPYNFGGPEPETDYPLPAEPEKAFPYGAGGHWDNTRRLRFSARDGFLPWAVIGALAPRPLIYAHEFAWDKEHDPVWPRLQKIYGWYDVKDKVAFAHGRCEQLNSW